MESIKKVWRWMGSPVPLWWNYIFVFFVILFLYLFFPNIWSNALPELIATFLGILTGYTLGVSREKSIREFDEERRMELKDIQKKENKEYFMKVLIDEIVENIEILNELEQVDNYTIPGALLRTSSWQATQKHIESFEDFEFIEKLFELYFKIEEMNRSVDYLRRHIFFTAVASPSEDKNRRYLAHEIRTNSTSLKTLCKEILDYIDVEKYFIDI